MIVSIFRKKNRNDNNEIITIIRKTFQNNFKNTQQIIVEFDNNQLSKNNINIFIMINNNQRIRKLKKNYKISI